MSAAEGMSAPEDAPGRQSGGDSEWLQALQLGADVSTDLGRLAALELRLALANLSRMLLLALAFLPLLLLSWLGLSLLLAVLCYQQTASASLGVLVFLAIQLLALWALCAAWVRYRRTLSLPRTRRQLRLFTG
jgi:uncharacterized membrane protein YqjE